MTIPSDQTGSDLGDILDSFLGRFSLLHWSDLPQVGLGACPGAAQDQGRDCRYPHFYANVSIRYTGIPQDQLDKASTTYRERASQLPARAHLVRGYDRWAVILKIPKRQAIVTASKALIGLSNNVFDTGLEATRIKEEYRREICHSLNLKIGT